MKSLDFNQKALESAYHGGELITYLISLAYLPSKEEGGGVLSRLHNLGKISLVSDDTLAAIEALSPNDFWSIINFFEHAIPELNCSHRDILRLVHTLVCKAGTDGASGIPNIALIKWCSANPEKAKQIVQGAKLLDEMCLSHCVFAVQGIGNTALAFELLEHSDKALVAVGLRSLGRLDLDSEAVANRVIDECCKVIAIEKNQKLRSSAIETAFSIWDRHGPLEPYRQQEFLEVIIRTKDGDELVQLSAALFYHSKGLVIESVDKILEALAGEVSNPQATLHWLDLSLHSQGKNWDLTKVIDVLTAQIPKLEHSIDPSNLHHFCQWIFEDPNNSAQLFSRWLISGQSRLCQFLADMMQLDGRKNKIIEISRLNLPSELEDQIFLARKCVGFLWFQEVTAASILLSIVKNGKKLARQAAEELLFNPLLLSYSGALRSFLEVQLKNPSKRITNCTKRILKLHDAYLAGLNQTKDLVEFYPTIEQRRASAMKDRERNKEIQKQAHEKSIFSKLLSHQVLLYGKKSFSLIQGEGGKKIASVMPLSEFSYSAEFPRVSVVDPVGFHEMITIFRIERRVSE